MKRYKPLFEDYDVSSDPWKRLRDKYYSQNISLDIYNNRHNISEISLIKIPKEFRSQGIAKQIMNEICKIADKLKITLSLTPTNEFGSSKSRLITFYKNFGFIMNSGKNKDYRISDTMLRLPK